MDLTGIELFIVWGIELFIKNIRKEKCRDDSETTPPFVESNVMLSMNRNGLVD